MTINKQNFIENYITNTFENNNDVSKEKINVLEFRLKKYFPKSLESNFLDIGIGKGELLYLWKDLGYLNIKGIDISEEVVNFCNRLFYEKLTFKISNPVEFLNKNKNNFDLITLIDVIEHISVDLVLELVLSLNESLKEWEWCRRPGSNRHEPRGPLDFESSASANSATSAR